LKIPPHTLKSAIFAISYGEKFEKVEERRKKAEEMKDKKHGCMYWKIPPPRDEYRCMAFGGET
jgi:hypothetical protein